MVKEKVSIQAGYRIMYGNTALLVMPYKTYAKQNGFFPTCDLTNKRRIMFREKQFPSTKTEKSAINNQMFLTLLPNTMYDNYVTCL